MAMPPPRPLTQCPSAQLDWTRPGTPAAPDFDDIYFSTDGGLEETRLVFLKGCGLPENWSETERFVIGELGFGSGLNFLATWQMWDAKNPPNGHLHFVSIEKFPFDKEQLSRALEAWPELKPYARQLIQAWPGRVRGFHRLHFGEVTLTLIHDDIESALSDLDMKANAWFLDGFSPAKNPDMWAPEIMTRLGEFSATGATLSTFTVAGSVRQALTQAGFHVEKKEGFGRKRHRLEASYSGKATKFSYQDFDAPIIIGAGIGGLSLASAFLRRGLKPILYEDLSHIAASGNPAALIKPRLDLQDRPESRFFLNSYLYALQAYQDTILSVGVKHIPKSESEALRYQKLLQQNALGKAHFQEGSEQTLLFPQALTISPLSFRNRTLEAVEYKSQKLDYLPSDKTSYFIAAGLGIKDLIADWPLRFSRGQITYVSPKAPLPQATSYGGYAIPLDDELLIGATHARLMEGRDPFALDSEDDTKNIVQFETYTGLKAANMAKTSRASVRVTSADTLPVIGQTDLGHFVLTGLGSRGFVFAPLLAEAIVSHYLGDPMPIAQSVWNKFSVNRLLT